MEALKASLRARGQQTPIEVVALSAGKGAVSHGLISGWRRLSALRALTAEEGGARFAHVKARLIAPESQQASYVAMVEENEIRSDLSHYERARIALRAWQEGVYPTLKLSLNGLFGSVSRSRRSKINSFVPLVEQLDGVLKFPSAISEKLGLALSRAIQDPAVCADLRAALKKTRRLRPEDELAVLQKALAPASRPRPVPKAAPPAGLHARLNTRAQRIEVTGSGVDHALFEDLQAWLAARGEGCG
jgi:hypothetical protein